MSKLRWDVRYEDTAIYMADKEDADKVIPPKVIAHLFEETIDGERFLLRKVEYEPSVDTYKGGD